MRLFEQCGAMLTSVSKGQYEVQYDDLYIDKRYLMSVDTREKVIHQIDDQQLLNTDIRQLVVARAIGKLTIKGFHSEFSPSLAINISEKGTEFALGEMVSICSNFTILRSDLFFSTFQKIKGANGNYVRLSIPDILRRLRKYMQEMERQFEEDFQKIETLKAITISQAEFHRFLGKMFSLIENVNHHRVQRTIKQLKGNKSLPITGRQLGQIAVEAYQPRHDIYRWKNDQTTLWNLINYGTEILKFHRGSDSASVLRANSNWVNLVQSFPFKTNHQQHYAPGPSSIAPPLGITLQTATATSQC